MIRIPVFLFSLAVVFGCGTRATEADDDTTSSADDDTTEPADDDTASPIAAHVQAVSTTGDPGDYTFAATLLTSDVDCDQYADWWEVLTPSGELLYRRILQHSHPDEQPFTRDGGPVPVQAGDEVIVRAHMNTAGYGGEAMRGSVSGGFTIDPKIGGDFASAVETQEPLPSDCLY